jgi:hypothetical protein
MTRRLAAAAVFAASLALAGCGLGAGPGSSDVRLTVTRDFGAHPVGQTRPAPTRGSENVIRFLERHFSVTTRYGGGFVQSIAGYGGGHQGGRPVDWFYYVNGVEAPRGAASTPLHAGDRVWWDRHDWGTAMRVPAVVGSFPEPFLHGVKGKRLPVRVECATDAGPACGAVAKALGDVQVLAARALVATEGGDDSLRVVVGPWSGVRTDRAARQVEQGPSASGVYARFVAGGQRLELLDARGHVVKTLGPGGGLIAATRYNDQPPTWFVTGTDAAGAKAAAALLDGGDLADRFALAVDAGRAVALPVAGGGA